MLQINASMYWLCLLSHIAKIIIAHLNIRFQSHYILFLRKKGQDLHIFVYFTKNSCQTSLKRILSVPWVWSPS